MELAPRNFSIYEVLEISVDSVLYDDRAEEIQILDYVLTRMTERALDV